MCFTSLQCVKRFSAIHAECFKSLHSCQTWPGTLAELRDKICTDPAKEKQKQPSNRRRTCVGYNVHVLHLPIL